MIAHIVTMQAYPEHLDEFLKAMMEHGEATEAEPACLLYQVLQEQSDPCRVHVYEVFRDEAGFEAHRIEPHNLAWRNLIEYWHHGENIHRRCVTVYPTDPEWLSDLHG